MDYTGGVAIHDMDPVECPNCEDGSLWPLGDPGHEGLVQMRCDNCEYKISQDF